MFVASLILQTTERIATKFSTFFPEGGVGLVPKRGCLLYVSILRIPQMI
jgi:hypothetical protein